MGGPQTKKKPLFERLLSSKTLICLVAGEGYEMEISCAFSRVNHSVQIGLDRGSSLGLLFFQRLIGQLAHYAGTHFTTTGPDSPNACVDKNETRRAPPIS